MTAASRAHCGSHSGSALIIVLSLIALVAVTVIAFLSSAALQRQISSNSTSQARVDIFAKGALAITVSDLEQEVVDGSTTPSSASTPPTLITTGGVTTTLYLPRASATLVPARVGSDSTLANLVKRSVNGTAFYSGANYANVGVSRAAASSTATASLNNHAVPIARWNEALLLPKKNTAQSTDMTPVTTFTAPDWIYLARDGTNPMAVSTSIVGRYAYAIYDEGGLLDVNSAGYPSTLTASQAGRKIGVGTADLTQVGLASADVDALVGWRSYASSQPTGSFPAYVFPAVASSNYYGALVSNASGFLTTSGALWNNQSDHMFGSRQELIRFLLQGIATSSTKRATLQNALQYLSTFSRDLDQPSYAPDPGRPRVVGPYAAGADGTLYTATSGGNNAYGSDDVINPPLLGKRATSGFTRNDGSVAAMGEPLVKKRFLLQRLCWITYEGPSSTLASTDPIVTQLVAQGVPLTLIQSGTDANILKYFGLTWNATSSSWSYAHGVSNAIGALSDVQGLAREPDFFELLKAGMTVGSLAKGGPSNHNGGATPNGLPVNVDTVQYNLDTNVDAQVLQIGANIIDQYDSDSYPTHLTLNGTDIRGVENLPYLCRARVVGVPVDLAASVAGGKGRGLMLLLPEVWNPNDPNAPAGSPRPTVFRFLLAGSSLTTAARGETRIFDYDLDTTDGTNGNECGNPESPNAGTTITQDSLTAPTGVTELDFSTATATACQNPVFVGTVNSTTGAAQATAVSLTVGTNNNLRTSGVSSAYADSNGYVKDVVSNLSYCGVLLGDFPLTWNVSSKIASSDKDFIQTSPFPVPLATTGAAATGIGTDGNTHTNSAKNPSTADQCILSSDPGVTQAHYLLQYKDAGSNWITYEDNYTILPAGGQNSVATGEDVPSASGWHMDISTALAKGNGTSTTNDSHWLTWIDPRTSRFGATLAETFKLSVTCSSTAKNYFGVADRPTSDYGMGVYYSAPGSGLTSNTSPPTSPNAYQVGWYPRRVETIVQKHSPSRFPGGEHDRDASCPAKQRELLHRCRRRGPARHGRLCFVDHHEHRGHADGNADRHAKPEPPLLPEPALSLRGGTRLRILRHAVAQPRFLHARKRGGAAARPLHDQRHE